MSSKRVPRRLIAPNNTSVSLNLHTTSNSSGTCCEILDQCHHLRRPGSATSCRYRMASQLSESSDDSPCWSERLPRGGRRGRMQDVMDILEPRIRRCTEIIFLQVIHRSSLPNLSADLQNISSSLAELHLECLNQHDDGAPTTEVTPHGHGETCRITSRHKPNATILHGYTILDILKHDREIFSKNFANKQL